MTVIGLSHKVQDAVRSGVGGVAPSATAAVLDDLAANQVADHAWLADVRTRLKLAADQRAEAIAAITQTTD